MEPQASCDVVVVGGAIVGVAAALALRRAGLRVVLIDPDLAPLPVGHGGETGPASVGNAGHVAAEQIRPLAHPSILPALPRRLFAAGGALDCGWHRPSAWMPWAVRAAACLPRWRHAEHALATLLADALPAWTRLAGSLDGEAIVAANGHFEIWPSARAACEAARGWRRQGTGTATLRPASDAEHCLAAAHLPRHPAHAIRFEGTGQVADPARAIASIAGAYADAGGRRLAARVRRLVPDGAGIEVAHDGTGPAVGARAVLLAAGLGTAPLLRALGIEFPLIAERGYYVEWRHDAAWDLPPVVFGDRSLIVTRFGDRLRAASFVEFDRADAPPDPRKWARLEAHVRDLGLPVASPFRRWIGARPTLPDYVPAIGPVRSVPGLFVASGHQHLGLTLAPITAELIADAIAASLGRAPATRPIPIACRPDRFGRRHGRSRRGRNTPR